MKLNIIHISLLVLRHIFKKYTRECSIEFKQNYFIFRTIERWSEFTFKVTSSDFINILRLKYIYIYITAINILQLLHAM